MTCSLPKGIEIEFPQSGVRIQPYEGDVKLKKRDYATASFTLSKAAGEVIGSQVENREPVIFKVDGTPAHRLVILSDSLDFRRNFDREDEALLELYDARHILDGGVISKLFKDARLGDVVSYILEQRDDPYGVITGVNYASEANKQELLDDVGTRAAEQIEFRPGEFFDSLQLVGNVHPDVQTLHFDNISPLQSLEKLTSELQYDFWIDENGVLNIGLDETWGQVMTINDRKKTSIRRLDVVEAHNKTNTVKIDGPYQSESSWFPEGALRGVAQATAPDIEGSSASAGISQASTLSDIRAVAERLLLRKIMEDVSGSAVINGLATENKEELAKLNVGDHALIDADAFNECGTSVDTGHYTIKNVHHRINPRQGWRVDIDISRVPTEINSNTWFYDPQDDKRYESVEAYRTDQLYDLKLRGAP